MIALVYHALTHNRDLPPFTSAHFALVATVTTLPSDPSASLGAVFEITNHVDAAWTHNAGVTAHTPHPRSTSVGDIVVLLDGSLATAHRCAPVGWVPVDSTGW